MSFRGNSTTCNSQYQTYLQKKKNTELFLLSHSLSSAHIYIFHCLLKSLFEIPDMHKLIC